MHSTLAQPKEPIDVAEAGADAAEDTPPFMKGMPSSVEFNKLRKRLLRQARQAIEDFAMVKPGERWLVALSGGKDSYGLLAVLMELQWRGLLPVEILACNLDQGQPNFPKHILPDYLDSIGIAHRIEYQDTYSVVTEKLPESSTYCSLCSRLRRGHLYRIAREEGCSSLVLGHHREDILETFFMNLFHGGRLAAMPPKLLNDEGDVMVLRPLSYCAEPDLAKFAEAMKFPIIPCDLCGSQDGLQRNAMKAMLTDIETRMPGRKDTMIRALTNARPSHLLDRRLFDFAGLTRAD
ncbi:tRNA 2-thiocytidine(32) synthetase TtcA [Nitratireductor sp. L1-7-SE]|uniref:tRNA-cytidine(32) 2-sulfurtransferase n=1 Tax=Nitratireductor rhodophyticola TaxID=2854036 RepID=A0ABS7R2C1_9HYPH|nr:tRNA 2-thiocytidine(32) synthetase TtcA [Nitratireductor rhodophyticola]MBY8919867.1 tRNA 2-thiocytidine(32) synthetase TtcA [Nitratireductor rhodophyticola]